MENTNRQDRNISRAVSPGDVRKLRRVLWRLKGANIITSFEEETGGIQLDNKIGFSARIHLGRMITFYFFTKGVNSPDAISIETASENSQGAQYFLTAKFSTNTLFEILTDRISRYNDGFNIEDFLFREITEYLSDNTKSHYGIKYVRRAEMEEDVAGADIYFGMKEGEFPLQLKKNVGGQQGHMKKFPKTPSYVFNRQLTTQETLKLFSKMGVSYFKGQIEHR